MVCHCWLIVSSWQSTILNSIVSQLTILPNLWYNEASNEQGSKHMKKSTSDNQDEQALALEETYRRGYHHVLARQRELLLGLLNEGIRYSNIIWWRHLHLSTNLLAVLCSSTR